jgi:hypothetical protein
MRGRTAALASRGCRRKRRAGGGACVVEALPSPGAEFVVGRSGAGVARRSPPLRTGGQGQDSTVRTLAPRAPNREVVAFHLVHDGEACGCGVKRRGVPPQVLLDHLRHQRNRAGVGRHTGRVSDLCDTPEALGAQRSGEVARRTSALTRRGGGSRAHSRELELGSARTGWVEEGPTLTVAASGGPGRRSEKRPCNSAA